MRVWIDLTNSPHVLVMRPVIELLRAEGHEVEVTARDFAQTLELLERFGIAHAAIGRHRGERLTAKTAGLLARSAALARWARASAPGERRGRRFDIALGHGSNDVTVAAAVLGIPSSTMFDYEFAALQHQVNCRLAHTVVVPDTIPPQRLYRYGARGKLAPYEGLKEEYYLADFEPDPAVLAELGLSRERALVVLRTPPDVALYHRFASDLFAELVQRLGALAREHALQVVVLPRTPAQRAALRALPELTVPARAVDAQSLVHYADLMISAGGTMNREAVALGTPVLSTFAGRLGAVDERLLREGRLRRLEAIQDLEPLLDRLRGRSGALQAVPGSGHEHACVRRDPRLLVELLMRPLAGRPREAA